MVFQESEGATIVDALLQPDHDCPYLDHIEDLLKKAGSELSAFGVSGLVRSRLAVVHENGDCPPTHPGGDMTKPGQEWADHLDYFRQSRDVI